MSWSPGWDQAPRKEQKFFVGYVGRADRNKGRTFKHGAATDYEEELCGGLSALASESWNPEWGGKVQAPSHYIGYVPKQERSALRIKTATKEANMRARKEDQRQQRQTRRAQSSAGRPATRPKWNGANARISTASSRSTSASPSRPMTRSMTRPMSRPMSRAPPGGDFESLAIMGKAISATGGHELRVPPLQRVPSRRTTATAGDDGDETGDKDGAGEEASDVLFVHTAADGTGEYTEDLFGNQARPKTPSTQKCGREIMQAWGH